MMELSEMVPGIVADGVVDADEVKQIREAALADGVVDLDEVKALFAINDAVSGNANDPAWTTAFVDLISQNILDDGIIDQEETDLLVSLIQGDDVVDATEMALLTNLEANCAGEFPAALKSLMVA